MSDFLDDVRAAVHRKAALSPKMREAVIEGLRAEGLLADPDTARLRRLGEAVGRRLQQALDEGGDGDAVRVCREIEQLATYREAGVEQ